MSTSAREALQCYHCGEECPAATISMAGKAFCCEGCKTVYQILQQSELCDYYALNPNPGLNRRIRVREGKFAFLDDEKIAAKLVSFQNESQVHITFYLPAIHCSSCLWLLENLHRLDEAVVSARVNFPARELALVFNRKGTSLRKLAELLTSIGYEPYISLENFNRPKPRLSRGLISQLGIAGFCFANIMLMSFPEYLGLQESGKFLQSAFRYLNLLLSLPVLLYSARPFYQSAWAGLKHKYLNIDAPIALAIIMTFGRSLYEVLSGTGSGYFDSMTGIVFFMLVGRVLQEKTYRQLSFDRDYTAYFPIAISVLKEGKESPVALPQIKPGDTLLIHNQELIPADGIITRGRALIDYSFVTGESMPVERDMGELAYAGGRQTGGNIEILVMKEVSQSYLTSLWNRDQGAGQKEDKEDASFVNGLSRYFTWIVLGLAITGALYWSFTDTGRAWNVLTTILIVACPCALLLAASFTNGHILRMLGRHRFYLKNAKAIEELAATRQLVFDKTGTLTDTLLQDLDYHGQPLTTLQQQQVAALAAQSSHPLSRMLVRKLPPHEHARVPGFQEYPGKGIEGFADETLIALGSAAFIGVNTKEKTKGTRIYLAIEGRYLGYFELHNHYREDLLPLLKKMSATYRISIISGDNDAERDRLRQVLGPGVQLLFNQQPHDKLEYVKKLQQGGQKVTMIGDGLNDAGALMQSDMGIALADNTNNFTPASNGILEAAGLKKIDRFIQVCRAGKKIIVASFILSVLYNIIGLSFALAGNLSPLVAAILMPASSITIILFTYLGTVAIEKRRLTSA